MVNPLFEAELLDVLKGLHKYNQDKKFPSSLEYISVTSTLYAAVTAQNELSDMDEYSPDIAKKILTSQGHDLSFYKCRSKRPVCSHKRDFQKYVLNGELPETLYIRAKKGNFSSIFEIFEEINLENPWSLPKEKLIYIPEEIFLGFGGRDYKSASVIFDRSDDPREDELPCITVSKTDEEALNFIRNSLPDFIKRKG